MLLLWSYWSNGDTCATEAVSLSKDKVAEHAKHWNSPFSISTSPTLSNIINLEIDISSPRLSANVWYAENFDLSTFMKISTAIFEVSRLRMSQEKVLFQFQDKNFVPQFSKRFDSTFWIKLSRSSILWRCGGGVALQSLAVPSYDCRVARGAYFTWTQCVPAAHVLRGTLVY